MERTINGIKQAVFSAPGWNSLIPGYQLGLFRILFGVLMTWEILYFIRIDFVEIFLTNPQVHLHYTWLDWVKPLPAPVLQGLVYLLLLCTILITLGKWYRPAIIAFTIGFTYLFLIDVAYYNNHLYLICLLSFWMIFLPMDATLAIGKSSPAPVEAGGLAVLRFHIILVYFFGGIAKINPEWLFQEQPVREIISQASFLEALFGFDFAVFLLVYGGLLFDLLAGFLLLYRPTRWIGFASAILFNATNAIVFNDINIFPFFMLGSLVLFLEPETVSGWFARKAKAKKGSGRRKKAGSTGPMLGQPVVMQPVISKLFVAYMVFQCIWPFRHFVIPGDVDWTGQGQRFAWRMKIQTRSTEELAFEVLDYRSKTIYPIDLDAYLINYDQRGAMGLYPAQVMQMVEFLSKRAAEKQGHPDVGVRARIKVSFNGRPAQWMVNPEQDLAKELYHPWGNNDWILPLENAR